MVLNQRVDHPEMRDAERPDGPARRDRPSGLCSRPRSSEGRGSTAELPIPSWSPAYDSAAVIATPYDTADAVGLPHDGGLAAGRGPAGRRRRRSAAYSLDLLTPDEASNPIVYRTARAGGRRTGARSGSTSPSTPCRPRPTSSRLDSGQFAAAVVDFEVGLDPDLGPLLLSSQVGSGGSNVSGHPGRDPRPAAADGAQDGRSGRSPGRRFRRSRSTFRRHVPILPLAFRDYDLVVSRRVQNVSGTEIADPSGRYWDVIDWRLASDG